MGPPEGVKDWAGAMSRECCLVAVRVAWVVILLAAAGPGLVAWGVNG